MESNFPDKKETKHWYLPMQDHAYWLKNWIENGKLDGEKHVEV
ncbi:hypothetical protein N9Y89_00380 [bacterium]|nr:hypothetical protein [bacterium]